MNSFVNLLFILSSFFGVQSTPLENGIWSFEKGWSGGKHPEIIFEAKSSNIKCPHGKYLQFPYVLYATQILDMGNGKKITIGSDDFSLSSNIFSQIYVPCDEIIQSSNLIWQVKGYSRYFARVSELPFVTDRSFFKVFNDTFYIGGSIGLGILATFFLITLINKENYIYLSVLFCSAFFLACYMALNVAPAFKIHLSVLAIHKLADISLFFGFFSLLYSFYLEKVLTRKFIITVLVVSCVGIAIIIFGSNGDEVQFGTSLPFISVIFSLFYLCARYFIRLRKLRDQENFLKFSFSILFTSMILWEMNIFSGAVAGVSIFPVCVLFAYFILVISVNERVRSTYRERDLLLSNLEAKVRERTTDLQKALSEKELAQAELIQSAKLASLGTLSAGIAHEINNSINYVNACLVGLDREIMKKELINFEKVEKLISTIKHGTKMTIEIVNSLRNFTGLNQSKMKEVDLKDVVHSVKTIIKRKLDKIILEEQYVGDTKLVCNVVGFNQLFMNLISNAIDVVDKDTGIINIVIANMVTYLEISIKDNGSGIPPDIIDKIFDPFFTTKEVGSGTGLGLHIVKKEVDAHNGKITINSSSDGTEFIIRLPVGMGQVGVA